MPDRSRSSSRRANAVVKLLPAVRRALHICGHVWRICCTFTLVLVVPAVTAIVMTAVSVYLFLGGRQQARSSFRTALAVGTGAYASLCWFEVADSGEVIPVDTIIGNVVTREMPATRFGRPMTQRIAIIFVRSVADEQFIISAGGYSAGDPVCAFISKGRFSGSIYLHEVRAGACRGGAH